MGICCCSLGPQTNSYQTEVLLIEHVSSPMGKITLVIVR